MKIDNDKLKRLKVLHLSYLTEADRQAAEATEDGFVLNGMLIEAVPDMVAKLAPDAKEYPSKTVDGVTKTTLPDNSVVVEVPVKKEEETFTLNPPHKAVISKKKSNSKKKA